MNEEDNYFYIGTGIHDKPMKPDPLDPMTVRAIDAYSYKYNTVMAILKALKIDVTVSADANKPGIVNINIALPPDLKERIEPTVWNLINDPAIRPLTDLIKVNYETT